MQYPKDEGGRGEMRPGDVIPIREQACLRLATTANQLEIDLPRRGEELVIKIFGSGETVKADPEGACIKSLGDGRTLVASYYRVGTMARIL